MRKFCNSHMASIARKELTLHRSGKSEKGVGLQLHDLQLQFCQIQCEYEGSGKRWHAQLLDGYLPIEGNSGRGAVEVRGWWSDAVAEDGYIYENVARHLVECGKRDELRALVLDAR